ncbi:phage fiber-tail adaptor protein [Streptomyces sp. NEAU-174]|uniref:phage fiber-tail adaptor protein n=1 Tax=Streptomyces sp. NEAU-174 TaxID=3458254 RepID=UPI004044FEEE
MPNNFVKDPQALLDYTWDWSAWLADVSDTISTATVTVPAGLTAVGAPTVGDTAVTQRVSGGTVDAAYAMVCQITTAGGLIDERSIYLTIGER